MGWLFRLYNKRTGRRDILEAVDSFAGEGGATLADVIHTHDYRERVCWSEEEALMHIERLEREGCIGGRTDCVPRRWVRASRD